MKHMTRLFLFAFVAATIACGSQNSQTAQATADDIDTETQDQILRMMGDEAAVEALNSEGISTELVLHAQDHLVVIGEEKSIGDGQTWVSVIVDRNDGSESELIYMKPQDIFDLPLALMTIENDADWAMGEDLSLPESLDVIIGGYEKSMPTMRVERMTYCYKYVKQYLLKVGLVKVYLPGGSAYMAANILPKHGFKKVARKPSQAIKHDVCVYKGGPSGHGHIEIMTSKGWYYGYGYKKSPIKNRVLMGCFHK